MVEFSMVAPVFFALIVGAILVYSWQLYINSAQFAALEGVQASLVPSEIGGSGGLLCTARKTALNALQNESFLSGTPAYTTTACGGPTPDYLSGNDCNPSTLNGLQTYSSMLAYLNAHAGSRTDLVMICAACIDLAVDTTPPCTTVNGGLGPDPKDEVELQVTVVGYKRLPLDVPILGNHIAFFGQNSETLQGFHK